jgi:ubiquinone/menaquinone biosynthesis C-methylase UbiE
LASRRYGFRFAGGAAPALLPFDPGGTMSKTKWGTDTVIWPTLQPPYVPSPRDIELAMAACPEGLLAAASAPRILVLGVTPALAAAPWPERSELHVVDFDPAMIEVQWRQREGAQCHCAFWQEMPFPDAHFDLVIGDCSFNALPSLDDYAEVLREIARVRRPAAPLVCRYFMQPEPRLSLAGLLDGAAGEIAGHSATAKRLLILTAAAQADGRLYFRDVPRRMSEQWSEVDDYLAAIGMTPGESERAKLTYEFDQYLTFPSRLQIEQRLAEQFSAIEFAFPDYDCGALCPTVSCR